MSFPIKRLLYERSPRIVKRAIGAVPFALLAGSSYRSVLRRGPAIDCLSALEVRALQERLLGPLLRHAVRQVPAYHAQRGIVDRLPPLEALKDFPPIDKDEVQRRRDEFVARDLASIAHYKTSTGGTTGNQLTVLLPDNSQAVETAFMHRQWARVGYHPSHRKATFRGVPFPHLPPGVYWQENPVYNELQFSPFHMNSGTLGAYLRQLQLWRPLFLHGYPSAVTLLADHVNRQGLEKPLPGLRAVFLGSEGCTPRQRSSIEQAFGCRVYTWYGHSERLVLAGECEDSEVYHCIPDYGLAELLDPTSGRPCGEGQRGEIVGTTFHNRAMPLIRYQTGDSAVLEPSRCACGRNWMRFSAVEGRWRQEVVVGKNGSRISVSALNMHGPVFDRVFRYQYHQDQPGVCLLKVVPGEGFRIEDARAIEVAYRSKVGDELDLRVVVVNDIPLTGRGKLRMLVTTLPDSAPTP